MGYANLALIMTFDGSDERYPNLGEDIWIKIRNPRMMPPSMMQPDVSIEVDPETGQPKTPEDEARATALGMEMLAKLICEWHVYDATVLDGDLLPLPTVDDVSSLHKLPGALVEALQQGIEGAFK